MPGRLIPLLAVAGVNWVEAKAFAERSLGVSNDALHVIAGVLLQLCLAAIWRGSLSRVWPVTVVLALQLANEAIDLTSDRWPSLGEQLGESAKDTGLTILLPREQDGQTGILGAFAQLFTQTGPAVARQVDCFIGQLQGQHDRYRPDSRERTAPDGGKA